MKPSPCQLALHQSAEAMLGDADDGAFPTNAPRNPYGSARRGQHPKDTTGAFLNCKKLRIAPAQPTSVHQSKILLPRQ